MLRVMLREMLRQVLRLILRWLLRLVPTSVLREMPTLVPTVVLRMLPRMVPTVLLPVLRTLLTGCCYAKRQEMKLQKEDEPMGFDLEAGDWVTPLGKGFHADMFFTAHRKIISERKYDGTLTVTFPNKGDGLVVAPTEPDDSNFPT
jgi:hypothetical protein